MASIRFSRILKILASAVADADEVYPLEGRLERFLHFWALVVRQFIRRRCLVHASALSYSTLLALIPLLVVALNVTSSLLRDKDEEKLSHLVEKAVASIAPPANIPAAGAAFAGSNSVVPPGTNFLAATNLALANVGTNAGGFLQVSKPPPPSDAGATVNTQKEVAQWIHNLVLKSSNGALGATGLIFLVITAISLLRGIEETFNDIWGVTRSRNWLMQIVLYWTIISLGPLLLSMALGLTGGVHLQQTRSFLESSPFLAPVVKHLLPIAIFSLTLALFYKLTPNTKVEFRAASIGGLCAGVSWHVYNQLGFLLVGRAMSTSKFYGGVFLIVLLMGGLYVLWVIILLGAQIAYAYQNRAAYLQDRLAENVNQRGREFVALRIMTCVGRRFQNGLLPATVPEISTELGVPSRLTQSVLRTLAATRLVSEVSGPEAAFNPARPLEAINAHDILIAMRTGTGQELPMDQAPELAEIYGEFARIEQAERNAAAGITLLALANRLTPQPALVAPQAPEPHMTAPAGEAPEKPAAAEPVESPKSEPAPEIKPPPEAVAETEPPRRETVRPDEETDFPL
jgi:membrane protein